MCAALYHSSCTAVVFPSYLNPLARAMAAAAGVSNQRKCFASMWITKIDKKAMLDGQEF